MGTAKYIKPDFKAHSRKEVEKTRPELVEHGCTTLMDSMVGGKISIYDTRCFLHLLDLPGRTNLETRERHPSLAKMVDRMVAEIGFNLHSYGNTIGNPYLRSDEKLKPLFELYQRVSKENNILLINLLL